jgi:hypothetical protein
MVIMASHRVRSPLLPLPLLLQLVEAVHGVAELSERHVVQSRKAQA